MAPFVLKDYAIKKQGLIREVMTKVKTLSTIKNLINKKCGECGWKTFSWISFNYVYCPKCQGLLEEFDMRNE